MYNNSEEPNASASYQKLERDRQPYIDRAIKNAKLTIPALFPKEGTTGSTDFETPWQSIGARGVDNLSAKLSLSLFPPNERFFRLGIDKKTLSALGTKPDKLAEVEQALMQIEDVIMRYMEANQIRITVHEAFLQLLVAGNCLLFLPPDRDGCRLYNLKKYVIKRDPLGNVLQIVTKDTMAKMALPSDVQAMIPDKKPDENVDVYTKVWLEDEQWHSYQEIEKEIVKGSENVYPKDKTPYIPLRMTKQDDESYGRSFVEEYYGDLLSYEKLSKALALAAMISANIVYLVNPNGVTRPKKLENAKAGDFVVGRREDISALQLEKSLDLNTSYQQAQAIESRLMFVFLLSSAVQRNAERVTAEEIRTVASELEDTLGGIYSILSQELQLPLIRRLLAKLTADGHIPELPKGVVEPTITTGIEALGRGHDFNKYMTFMKVLGGMPDAFQYMNLGNWITALATSLGIDTNGLVKTQEQIEQEQQQAMENQAAMAMVQNGTKGDMTANGTDTGAL